MGVPASPPLPAAFRRAVEQLRAAAVRPEVAIAESPAPARLAPFSVAVTGEVVVAGEELAHGRLVLLHDPAGQEAWEGTSRFVGYLRAPLDPEIAADPLLPSVGWSWLLESLERAGARYHATAGTVSRVSSERFGTLSGQPDAAEVELRASWTPDENDLAAHLTAFSELLCTAAGLPPAPPGVVPMPRRRAARRRRS
jgi:hypothetical protein